jgi:hypothetical protein
LNFVVWSLNVLIDHKTHFELVFQLDVVPHLSGVSSSKQALKPSLLAKSM